MIEAYLPHTPYVPFDSEVGLYSIHFGLAKAVEYAGWKEEVMSWKQSAYIHGGLNPTQTYRIWGRDALRLLSEHCVNSMANFSVGAAKHAIMCNDDGLIMTHGVLVRLGEEEFMTYWLMPWINLLAGSGEYDVKGEDLTGKVFLFQVAGPRSLEILEAATGEDLRDIRFLRQRRSTVAGTDVKIGATDVNVLRLGMAGSLAYELHGPIERARAVYAAVVKAGEPFGIQRLGWGQYMMNHTENGFPQAHMHFLCPWFEHPQLAKNLIAMGRGSAAPPLLKGSAGPNIQLRYRNPVELGWAHVIKFDHEFQGRKVLEREVAKPTRKMVTLSWNADDILDIYRSHLQPGEEYAFMDFTQPRTGKRVGGVHFSDLVLKNGKTVGISSGRIYSYYYRQMISLCSIDAAAGELGEEVLVLWGDPGTRQKQIRATVERFPFYNENRNEKLDVSAIPKSESARQ
jgi:glycine cleavage system aminomethyltransferase T